MNYLDKKQYQPQSAQGLRIRQELRARHRGALVVPAIFLKFKKYGGPPLPLRLPHPSLARILRHSLLETDIAFLSLKKRFLFVW